MADRYVVRRGNIYMGQGFPNGPPWVSSHLHARIFPTRAAANTAAERSHVLRPAGSISVRARVVRLIPRRRCETCRHWSKYTGGKVGVCAVLRFASDDPCRSSPTARDFGCTLHEPREAT